jgi:hypothetical protein
MEFATDGDLQAKINHAIDNKTMINEDLIWKLTKEVTRGL